MQASSTKATTSTRGRDSLPLEATTLGQRHNSETGCCSACRRTGVALRVRSAEPAIAGRLAKRRSRPASQSAARVRATHYGSDPRASPERERRVRGTLRECLHAGDPDVRSAGMRSTALTRMDRHQRQSARRASRSARCGSRSPRLYRRRWFSTHWPSAKPSTFSPFGTAAVPCAAT